MALVPASLRHPALRRGGGRRGPTNGRCFVRLLFFTAQSERQEGLELFAYDPRVVASLNGHDTFDGQRPAADFFLVALLQPLADRQPEYVRAEHAVQRGDEGRGDALAQLIRLVEMAEDVDQTHDGTDDAHGRREATPSGKHREVP